jgi:hypothetical protein
MLLVMRKDALSSMFAGKESCMEDEFKDVKEVIDQVLAKLRASGTEAVDYLHSELEQ